MIWYTVCAFAVPMSKNRKTKTLKKNRKTKKKPKNTQNTNKCNGMACNCNQSMIDQSNERRDYNCPGAPQYPYNRFKGGVSLKDTPCMVLYICAGVLQPLPPNQI